MHESLCRCTDRLKGIIFQPFLRNFDMKIDEKLAPMSTEETKEGWESFWSKLPHSAPLHNSLQPVESRILYIPRSL